MIDLGEYAVDPEAVSVMFRRKSGGAYNDDGDWVGEVLTDTVGLATVQPAMGRKLEDLPEGERNEAKYFLWTREALALDDVVIYGGEQLRVIFVWPRPDGGFTRAALGRLRQQ